MTLPTSGTISLDMLITELRTTSASRAYPINLLDADVLALAGKGGPPVVLPNDFYGKGAYTSMSGSIPDVSDTASANPSSSYTYSVPVSVQLTGGVAPFTYTWSRVSGSGTVVSQNSAKTNAQFTVARFSEAGTVESQVVQCVVQDATGAQLVRQGTVTLTLQ